MSISRSKLAERDRRFIIGRSGGCCNKCKRQVFQENEFFERARLADDAHVYSYSTDGPRGRNANRPVDENAVSNIILLCKVCHSIVDQQPLEFGTCVLTKMREDHYRWVERCLGQKEIVKPKFNYIIYLNLPRLDMFAVSNSIPLPVIDLGKAKKFADCGFEAGRIMSSYTEILNYESINAHQVDKNIDLSLLEVGTQLFIDKCCFRTVAINKHKDLARAWAVNKSILYRIYDTWKLICLIDPRWITTCTAGVVLNEGQISVSMLIRVNSVSVETREVSASPLFMAQ